MRKPSLADQAALAQVTQMERQGRAGCGAMLHGSRWTPSLPALVTLTPAPAWPGEGVREQRLLPLHSGRQLAPWCCRGQEPGKKYHVIKMTNPFAN